ncbi:AzlC family ABC transporter permease [Alcaligenes sp. SDU_A2]|uniref:AzlC family ABC transporter permease n=1 Tax=Alcaligenes sp. SDU_A2 TaxID=3136634 RepID=UPI002BA57B56|nr:AzlC family ABC transporter permease [Alcaligenes sp.]HRL28557.1 AzlC family ABC transporter permease [Alcaligenes sp.]
MISRAAYIRGLRDSASIALGYVPVAISFGLAAVHAGLSAWLAVLVSLVVYAGASQFILISLLAAGAAYPSILGIVVLMNLRHLFYGPALLGFFSGPRTVRSLWLAPGLTDEVFAASAGSLSRQPPQEQESWYCGLQLGAYGAWVGGTAVGAFFAGDLLGQSPVLEKTLGFVLPALFFALLLEIRRSAPVAVMLGAALSAVLAMLFLPSYLAIIAGMLAGGLMALRRA